VRISEREAAQRLGRARGTSREASRRVLVAGLAGPGERIGTTTSYDAEAVHRLARRLTARVLDLHGLAAGGLLNVRASATRKDVRRALASNPLELMAGPWRMGWYDRVGVAGILRNRGALPLVLTVSNYVVAGAEIEGYELGDRIERGARPMTTLRFTVRPVTSDWFTPFEHSIMRGRSGSVWSWWPVDRYMPWS
jgi:hypothetical protein